MKTTRQLQTEIDDLIREGLDLKLTVCKTPAEIENKHKRQKQISKQILLLTDAKRWVELYGHASAARSELQGLEKTESERLGRFDTWKKYFTDTETINKGHAAIKKRFEEEMGLPKLRTQIRMLKLILN